MVTTLNQAADYGHSAQKRRKVKHVVGWNKHVRLTHAAARLTFQTWILHRKPTSGTSFNNMCETRYFFK